MGSSRNYRENSINLVNCGCRKDDERAEEEEGGGKTKYMGHVQSLVVSAAISHLVTILAIIMVFRQ